MEGWGAHGTLEEDWVKTCQRSAEQYDSGRFLIERLGAERFLDPALMATIWGLRQRLVEELGTTTHAECMLIDCAVLAYYNTLRVQGWLGNLALSIEHEFFAREAPSAKLKRQYGSAAVEGLHVEDLFHQFSERLLPLLDRSNRLLIRNLKAVRELRQAPVPNVSVGTVSQVNVGAVQQNEAGDPTGVRARVEARLAELSARRRASGDPPPAQTTRRAGRASGARGEA